MTTNADETFGGGFAEVRDGRTVQTVTRPAPEALTAAGPPGEDADRYGVILVALPGPGEPVNDIGPEQPKHATLLHFGDLDGGDPDRTNPGLTDDFRALLEEVCGTVAAAQSSLAEDVTGVESLGDSGARVWMLDGTMLTQLRDALLAEDPEVATVMDAVDQFPSFRPHVTIGYADTPGEGSEAGGHDGRVSSVSADASPRATEGDHRSSAAPHLPGSGGRDARPSAATDGGRTPHKRDAAVRPGFTPPGDESRGARRPARGSSAPPSVPEARDPLGPVRPAGLGSMPSLRAGADGGVQESGRLDPDTEDAAAAVEWVGFDRVALWWGTDQTEWALAAPDEETEMSTESITYRTRPVTAAAGDPAPVLQTLDAGDPAPTMLGEVELDDRFYGVLIPENSQTGDRRVFDNGSVRLDAPVPMPIGWQVQDAPGHDGAVVCGRFDTFTRIGSLIAYTGTWDLDGAGYETRRLVDGGFLTGISADTDDCEVQIITEEGLPLGGMDFMFSDEEPLLLVTDSRIRGGTMCRVPAFTEAFVANGTPPDGWAGERPGVVVDAEAERLVDDIPEEVAAVELVAAATRADNPPVLQPVDSRYFSNPQLAEPTPLTVDPDGRVFGHIATWGTCHIGIEGYCQEPPASPSNYAYFATGALPTADGGRVHVGALTMGTGHARPGATLREAVEHYDHTGSVVADITTGQDGVGIWFSGRLRPDATPAQIHALAAAGSVSGDWREAVRFSGDLELIAALVVNVPGFPIARPALAASGGRVTALVAAGALPGATGGAYTLQEAATLAADLLEDRMARRDRAIAASGKMSRARRTRIVARIDSALRRADRSS